MEAAAIAEHRRSPCSTPRCAIGNSGIRNASTSTMSGGGDGPRHRIAHDALVDPLALRGGHQLRVADTGDVFLRVKHDGGGHDGAGQTAASYFIDARYAHEPDTPQRVLERA